MKKEPTLVIMAAGMGSRYGGLKQIDEIGVNGESLLEFSVFDAIEAGFKRVVFIIKKDIEAVFKKAVGAKFEGKIKVDYVFQELSMLPEGLAVPEGRVKPWGTVHAVLCCEAIIDGPFVVINADDYYGKASYVTLYKALTASDAIAGTYFMIGYQVDKTLTDYGAVTRGICQSDDKGFLVEIEEIQKIYRNKGKVEYETEEGVAELSMESLVSMNFWGYGVDVFPLLKQAFKQFIVDNLEVNPQKCEYVLPTFIADLLKEDLCRVKVLPSVDTWYGVTYKEDKVYVQKALKRLQDEGKYPHNLWG